MKALSGITGLLSVCLAGWLCSGALRAQNAPVEVTDSDASVSAPASVPIPERNPARLPAPPPHPSQIQVADWSAQEIQAALDKCGMMLAGIGASYRHLASLREGVCGAPAPIELSSIGTNPSVAIIPPAKVTCGIAASLSAWSDTVLQPVALAHLGENITQIRNVASYVCRNRYNAPNKRISEHARANALDMAAFKTSSGNWISVLKDWALPPEPSAETPVEPVSGVNVAQQETKPPQSNWPAALDRSPPQSAQQEFNPKAAFLFDIHKGACSLFGTVLGPQSNDAHKDHFHFDLAARKHTNYCE